jgi:rare lipoprotein A (peptidoglycan hydrolase)
MRRSQGTTTLLCILAATLLSPASCALAITGGAVAAAPPAAAVPTIPGSFPKALATWFGPGFYGQMTACGQVLTPAVVGVAHRTLPCGTLLRVSYHHHRLVVPVIDRGPYGHNGAAFDLTAGAAQALGIEGSARIGARVVGRAANVATLGLPPVAADAAASTAKAASVAGGIAAG